MIGGRGGVRIRGRSSVKAVNIMKASGRRAEGDGNGQKSSRYPPSENQRVLMDVGR
jgi:hypothetical protein